MRFYAQDALALMHAAKLGTPPNAKIPCSFPFNLSPPEKGRACPPYWAMLVGGREDRAREAESTCPTAQRHPLCLNDRDGAHGTGPISGRPGAQSEFSDLRRQKAWQLRSLWHELCG